jgi:Raf kinase inhibitor-like YbhB/YbcL family protein
MEKTFTLKSKNLGGNFTKKNMMDNFGCQGNNISPDLYWENVPQGTKSFALTIHDPDAPTDSGFWHWSVFNLPADCNSLPEDAGNPDKKLLPEGAFMGRSDEGRKAYAGPCPPEGDFTHLYLITVYALDTEKVGFDSDTPMSQCIFQLVTQHEIARASLVAYYKR